jgi:hypothetical protein
LGARGRRRQRAGHDADAGGRKHVIALGQAGGDGAAGSVASAGGVDHPYRGRGHQRRFAVERDGGACRAERDDDGLRAEREQATRGRGAVVADGAIEQLGGLGLVDHQQVDTREQAAAIARLGRRVQHHDGAEGARGAHQGFEGREGQLEREQQHRRPNPLD